jgi:hypothetical protein
MGRKSVACFGTVPVWGITVSSDFNCSPASRLPGFLLCLRFASPKEMVWSTAEPESESTLSD